MMRRARLLGFALSVMMAAAAVLAAQSVGPQSVRQAQKAATVASGATAARPAGQQGAAKATPAAPARSAAQAPAPAAKPAAGAARPSVAQRDADRRDPFRPTIQPPKPGEGQTQIDCPPGVRGILIAQAELNGVARGPNGMIAVVTTSNTGRTYFLRENAPLCNGRVTRITGDSIVFEENALDITGKPVKREVIKKIPSDAK